MVVHGGAWRTGDKRSDFTLRMVSMFLPEYAVASVNYRLTDEAPFPAQILDVKAAVRWLHANAAAYGLDPARVAAARGSAGGHLAEHRARELGVAEAAANPISYLRNT